MSKRKIIYFLSAVVTIIGCYALNLSYSLFIDTKEKDIVSSSVPELSYTLSIPTIEVEPNKEYLIKQIITNNSDVPINYGLIANPDKKNYTIKLADIENNISYGTLEAKGSSSVYLYIKNNNQENNMIVTFSLDINYSTLNYNFDSYLLTNNIDVENKYIIETTNIPFSKNELSIEQTIINKYITSNKYNKETILGTTNDITDIFLENQSIIPLPVSIKDANLNIDNIEFDNIEFNDVGLKQIEDDYGINYYYRGNITDNYINYANMCWKIFGVNGNGTIKLLLDNQNNICNTDDYKQDYIIDKTIFKYDKIVDILNKFQNEKLLNRTDNLELVHITYDNIKYNDNYEITPDDTDTYYYDSYIRIVHNKMPSLIRKESVQNMETIDLYTNIITADEVLLSGGNYNMINNSYFIKGNYDYWTSSTSNETITDGYSFMVNNNGELKIQNINEEYGIRPMITLKNNIKIISGDGNINNPYIIE